MENEQSIKDLNNDHSMAMDNIAVEAPKTQEHMVLRTENLVKKYGKRTVVSHVSIDVKQGEIVGLLGPNGAGKTTTFYMAVGLIVPNEGQIFLGDQNITKFPVYKKPPSSAKCLWRIISFLFLK